MNETVFAQWIVDKTQYRFLIGFAVTVAVVSFLLISVFFYFVIQTKNIIFATVPGILFLLVFGFCAEAFLAWSCVDESGKIYITDKGIYLCSLADPNQFKFVRWEDISSYDLKYFLSKTFLGKFFPKPTKFFLKGHYETDSFSFLAFGENVDISRAYLKEKNVPFGFIRS